MYVILYTYYITSLHPLADLGYTTEPNRKIVFYILAINCSFKSKMSVENKKKCT